MNRFSTPLCFIWIARCTSAFVVDFSSRTKQLTGLAASSPFHNRRFATTSPTWAQQQHHSTIITTASNTRRYFHSTTSTSMSAAKPGVATPEELKAFVEQAGERLLVVDVRNPDATVEPGDQTSLAVAALPSASHRPQAQHLIWDRHTDSMPLPKNVAKDTPIITHCGGGGRGQKAKDYLMKHGYTNVLNGGGPKETECWKEFGEK